jgi:hypothetical protein
MRRTTSSMRRQGAGESVANRQSALAAVLLLPDNVEAPRDTVRRSAPSPSCE